MKGPERFHIVLWLSAKIRITSSWAFEGRVLTLPQSLVLRADEVIQ